MSRILVSNVPCRVPRERGVYCAFGLAQRFVATNERIDYRYAETEVAKQNPTSVLVLTQLWNYSLEPHQRVRPSMGIDCRGANSAKTKNIADIAPVNQNGRPFALGHFTDAILE